jgi:acyl-CoA synthetase (AMP-forming)/AMP-acid ligase II
VLVVEAAYYERIQSLLSDLPSLQTVVVIGGSVKGTLDYDDFVAAARATRPSIHVNEDDTAWLLYTSGTTGFPKGAMLTHRGLVAAALESAIEYQPGRDERTLMAFPLCHVAGYLVTVNMVRGGLLVLMRAYEPELWMRMVDEYGITSSGLAPTMVNFLLQHPAIGSYRLETLTGLGYGAAAMPVEVLKAAMDRFGPIVYSGFGMTELGGNVLNHPKDVHVRATKGEEHLLAACGQPMCMADVKVVDESMQECPPGAVGELVVRGEQVLKGYFRNDDATEDAFEGDWFHSGDMARRDEEGFFYIVDRKKDMIVTGAENVYSREVEEAIYTHPAVSEVAVIGLPDLTWGERVVAVVALRAGEEACEADIVNVCRDRLAGFKKPKQVLFIDEIPKNVSGKILKRELRARFANGRSEESCPS